MIVICGLSFSGKSTLASAIARRFAYQEIDVDEVARGIYKLDIDDPGLKDLDWDRIYDEADTQIESLLKSGITVIDASRNFTKQERDRARQVAERSNARQVTIFVDTPEPIARERRLRNRSTGARRDITDEQFDEILQVMQPPTDDEGTLVFHHDDDIASWLERNSLNLEVRR